MIHLDARTDPPLGYRGLVPVVPDFDNHGCVQIVTVQGYLNTRRAGSDSAPDQLSERQDLLPNLRDS